MTDLIKSLSNGTTTWDAILEKEQSLPSITNLSVVYDDEKKEFIRFVKYRQAADNEAPNEIYKRVFEDNKKYQFENDIYSVEFFDFILQILGGVAGLENDAEIDKVKNMGL